MLGSAQVWNIVGAPFQWVIQIPILLPLSLLLFGLVMLRYVKRNQKGLMFSISFMMTALLAVGWLNHSVPLMASVMRMLQKMPFGAMVPSIVASAAGLGALTALAASFTQIQMSRYIALDELYHQIALMPDIDEDNVRHRCDLFSVLFWMAEAGMLFGMSRYPQSFRAALPQALVQPPLALLLQGKFSLEILFAALMVLGAGGVVVALFIPALRNHETTLSGIIQALRMTVYLVLMFFASVSGAVYLMVACALTLKLSARFVRREYCLPEDCIPLSWFAPEMRHSLLCGFREADTINAQGSDTVNIEEVSMLKCVHVLNGLDDIAFLQSDMSRDALWHQRFTVNDRIVVCARCRKVFFADDFTDTCPLCSSHDKLWFSHPAALLLRKRTTLPGGAITERPFKATLLSCIKEQKRHLPDNPSFAECCEWLLMPAAMYVLILLIYI